MTTTTIQYLHIQHENQIVRCVHEIKANTRTPTRIHRDRIDGVRKQYGTRPFVPGEHRRATEINYTANTLNTRRRNRRTLTHSHTGHTLGAHI